MEARDIQRLQEQTARLTPDQRARIVDALARALIAELRETGVVPASTSTADLPEAPTPESPGVSGDLPR
jgi:hypothetical protein